MTLKVVDKIKAVSCFNRNVSKLKLISKKKITEITFCMVAWIIRLENSAPQGRIPQKSIRKKIVYFLQHYSINSITAAIVTEQNF
jgi:hypothetical protein